MDVVHPDCEIEEMLQEGGSAAEGDYDRKAAFVYTSPANELVNPG